MLTQGPARKRPDSPHPRGAPRLKRDQTETQVEARVRKLVDHFDGLTTNAFIKRAFDVIRTTPPTTLRKVGLTSAFKTAVAQLPTQGS